MKKLVVLLIMVALLIPFACFAETTTTENDTFTFVDGIKFGMSRDEIIKLENDIKFDVYDNYIAYIGFKSAGNDAMLAYFFDDADVLNTIFVQYTDTHTNANNYIDDFENIDEALIEKYGAPTINAHYSWSNSMYKNDEEYYGLAISMGYLTILSSWELSNVTIYHLVNGDNYKITHSLRYELPGYEDTTNTSGI